MMHINNINIHIRFIASIVLYALLSNSGCYAAVSIPGYEYVGEGSCFGANGGYHPSPLSVSATDTFDPNTPLNCAAFCNNFRSIGESFRGFDGGYYGCQCRFDVGVTEELLSPIYMSLDNEVNWVDQFSYVETGEITSSDGYSYDWEFNINKGFNYCYKVVPFESPPIDDEDTECVDTQDYEDQWGGKCAEYESNANWCGGYGAMGESGLTPNENCCVCKSKLASSTSLDIVVEDTIASVSSPCFNADDGGRDGVLYNAVRAYVDQDCANNQECEIGQTYGWPMNSWCLGNVKDMSWLFSGMETFNENISDWNTSSVKYMNRMFWKASSFNGDLLWDTSSVIDMSWMFQYAESFDGNVSSFDTSSVTNMFGMFHIAKAFNGDVSGFDISKVTNMGEMFASATSFNKDLCSWQDNFPYKYIATRIFTNSGCTYQDDPKKDQKGPFCASDCQSSSVTPPTKVPLTTARPTTQPPTTPPTSVSGQSTPSTSSTCFGADDGGCVDDDSGQCVLYNAVRSYVDQDCANNQECEIGQTYGWPINSWCVGSVKDMSYLFSQMDTFNEDISDWNTSSVTNMNSMFLGASSFNRDLIWNTASVTDMRQMFEEATAFNGDLSNFDTSSVTRMNSMFNEATSFDGDVSNFNTSSVTNMIGMFAYATSFNGDVSNFNTSSVTDMRWMFESATSFNGDLYFDTSRVTDMGFMFRGATSFNGDVSNFNISSVTDMYRMFLNATSFNRDLSNFDISKVTNMGEMFASATSFNKDLCSWQDNFPYTNAANIFNNTNCTYQDTPQEVQKGPFCASDCQSSSVVDQASALDDNTQTDNETEEVETNDETSYPGDVEGFDYVGTGNCRDNGEQSYPSVTQIYTFSTEECANFCMKVGVDQSLGVIRGYVWGGDIPGGLQIHCNCWFDSGADTEAIALQYGGEREHWGIMEPARFSMEGQGTGMISGTAESDYEVYCYKVVDSEPTTVEEPWGVEETSPLSTGTPSKQMTFPPYSFDSTFFSSSNTPTVAVCPEEEAAFQNCITIDVDNIGSFVDCSLCGLEAMGDDIFDFDGYCNRKV